MRNWAKFSAACAMCIATMFAAPVAAQGVIEGFATAPNSGDTGWVLAASAIALLTLVPGALLSLGGAHGRAMVARILPTAIAAIAISLLLYIGFGYSLAFSGDGNDWIGSGANFMLGGMGTMRDGTTIAETAFVALQATYVFAAIAMLIGWVAPRAGRGWMIGFATLWSVIVLTPVMRLIWGGGWLAGQGALDGSGGLSIFLSAAVSALVALVLIGRRADAPPAAAADPTGQLTGAALMLVGMVAIAGGSTLGAGDNAAVAMLSLLSAAATGALGQCALSRTWNAAALTKGIWIAIAAIAVAGDGVALGSAWIIAGAAVLVATLARMLTPERIGWQDASGSVIPTIAACLIGALLFALFLGFAPFGGSGYPEGMGMGDQMRAQIIAFGLITTWSAVGSAIVALSMALILPMRAGQLDPDAD